MKTPRVRRRGIVRLIAVAGLVAVLGAPGLSSADQPILKAACNAVRETGTQNGDLVLTTLDKVGTTVLYHTVPQAAPFQPTKQYDVLVGWYERTWVQVQSVWRLTGVMHHEVARAACQRTPR